jgi:hypothetical protein
MLADQSGVSERYLGRIEDATGNVSLLVLRSLAAVLAVTQETHLRRLGLDELGVPGRCARAGYDALLATRGRLFARADAELDTSAVTPEAAGAALAALAG